MVDDVRETPPQDTPSRESPPIVWLSPNCCALTPAVPPQPRAVPLPERDTPKPAAPLPRRLIGLLKRRPRADRVAGRRG